MFFFGYVCLWFVLSLFFLSLSLFASLLLSLSQGDLMIGFVICQSLVKSRLDIHCEGRVPLIIRIRYTWRVCYLSETLQPIRKRHFLLYLIVTCLFSVL